MSVMVAPLALSTTIGNGVGQSFIQCIGTPPKKPSAPVPMAACDFGLAWRENFGFGGAQLRNAGKADAALDAPIQSCPLSRLPPEVLHP